MQFDVYDLNGSKEYFEGPGANRWAEIESIISNVKPQFQPSDQAGKQGEPIFDPKGTNAKLTSAAALQGWHKVPVPAELKPFGSDWDAGKGAVLAEWQFSNYPFLWNNVIRSEAVFQSKRQLTQLTAPAEALVVVTKSGRFPASNSTLYFEQARAQLDTVTTLGVFEMPIRIVGLTVMEIATMLEIDWNSYAGRYARVATSIPRVMRVAWGRTQQYGNRTMRLF